MFALSPGAGAARIALALAVGLLIGLEREWSNKDAGVRTCALTALGGMLAALISPGFAVAGFFGAITLVVLINLRSFRANASFEVTTSAALLLVYVAGALIGQGDYFTPVAVVIVATWLLALKIELQHFTAALSLAEIRAALWLGMIAFVVYPVLPNREVDRWGLFNPHVVWMAVIVVAAVGFATYLLMRLFSTRGLYTAAVLGGAVSSAATVAELGTAIRDMETGPDTDRAGLGVTITLLATLAMFGRNLILLALFAAAAVSAAWLPLAVMTAIALVMIWRRRARSSPHGQSLKLASPLSLGIVVKFGLLFVAVEIATILAERSWGHYGVYAVAVLGGFFNSASTVAAVGEMASHRSLTPHAAGVAAVIASIASAVANAPIMNRVLRERGIGWTNEILAWSLAAAGAAVLAFEAVHR